VSQRTHLSLWPSAASAEYVAAREKLLEAERMLRDSIESVAAARRALPPGPVLAEYVFAEGPPDLGLAEPVSSPTLSEVFGDHDTLVIYHLMFAADADEACPMCSMWVDGLHGVSHHLSRHTAFAVVAKAPLRRLRAWGLRRGWDGIRLLSSHDNTFNTDLHAEDTDGQRPGISVFVKDGGRVGHFYTVHAGFSAAEPERGIDLYSPVWQVLDLLPQGRGAWYAANTYAGRDRGDGAHRGESTN
jgi:predicted dithiol-disulfide oxidoreductase (DUF899 family)